MSVSVFPWRRVGARGDGAIEQPARKDYTAMKLMIMIALMSACATSYEPMTATVTSNLCTETDLEAGTCANPMQIGLYNGELYAASVYPSGYYEISSGCTKGTTATYCELTFDVPLAPNGQITCEVVQEIDSTTGDTWYDTVCEITE